MNGEDVEGTSRGLHQHISGTAYSPIIFVNGLQKTKKINKDGVRSGIEPRA